MRRVVVVGLVSFIGQSRFSTYPTMEASLDRSSRCAASTADTMAPSSADKSHISCATKNFRARLKKAAGLLEALTAITCLGCSPLPVGLPSPLGFVVSVVDDDGSGYMVALPVEAGGLVSSSSVVVPVLPAVD